MLSSCRAVYNATHRAQLPSVTTMIAAATHTLFRMFEHVGWFLVVCNVCAWGHWIVTSRQHSRTALPACLGQKMPPARNTHTKMSSCQVVYTTQTDPGIHLMSQHFATQQRLHVHAFLSDNAHKTAQPFVVAAAAEWRPKHTHSSYAKQTQSIVARFVRGVTGQSSSNQTQQSSIACQPWAIATSI